MNYGTSSVGSPSALASSGSEGIEAAIKFSRAHTGRTGLLYATTAVGSFLALAFFLAVVALEKAVVRWKPATLPP